MTELPRASAQDGTMHPEDAAIKTSVKDDSSEPSRTGSRIGRYLILEHLGCGGMGHVYVGRDTELDRLVALKFLTPAVLGVQSGVQRFIREAKAASGINHPNIVTIHEVMQFESTLAIVMELVDGTALRKLCGTPMPIDQAVAFAEQIAQALAVAHAAGIVHRDVKPENIMVRRDGYIKLLDFGLAHQITSEQHSSGSGLPNGTWRYMSPEQARGEQLSPQSDIFSFGLVLYEICTGSHPFSAESPFETLHAIGARPAERPALLNPFVPEKLELLVLAMLAKNAADRPSAAEVAQELRQFHRRNSRDDMPIATAPIPSDSAKTARRRSTPIVLKWMAVAAVSLLLGMLIPMAHWNTAAAKAGSASLKPTHSNTSAVPDSLAFEDYLKGRYQWNQRTAESLGSAAAFFEKAIARDEKYAAAYAGLADTYSMMGEFEMLAPEEAHRRAKLAALKALQIDENLAEAHSSLAYAKAAYDRDWAGAEQEFKRAIELSPSYSTAHHWYGRSLMAMGRHAEALVEIRRAQELDPLAQAVAIDLGWSFYVARHYDMAVAQLRSAVAMSPQQPFAHYKLGFALVQAGQPQQALTEFRQSATLSKGGAQYLAGMGFGYSMAGRKSEARRTLAALLRMRAEHRPVLASGVAVVYAGMEDKDQALSWLEKAYEERDDNVYALNTDPLFDSIRPDPRCGNLLGRLGFTP